MKKTAPVAPDNLANRAADFNLCKYNYALTLQINAHFSPLCEIAIELYLEHSAFQAILLYFEDIALEGGFEAASLRLQLARTLAAGNLQGRNTN